MKKLIPNPVNVSLWNTKVSNLILERLMPLARNAKVFLFSCVNLILGWNAYTLKI